MTARKKVNKEGIKVGLAYDAFRDAIEESLHQKIDIIKDNSEIKLYDLIIFSGGEDVDPIIYGEQNMYCSTTNRNRDKTEINIFNYINNSAALSKRMKLLGICRGHQLINVLKGGSLIQDIYFCEGISHHGNHPVTLNKTTEFSSIFKSVNSLHHQAIIRPGSGLVATSYYQKGNKSGAPIIESCENNNVLTVQYHPEFMSTPESREFWEKIKVWAGGGLKFKEETPPEPPNSVGVDYSQYSKDLHLCRALNISYEELLRRRANGETISENTPRRPTLTVDIDFNSFTTADSSSWRTTFSNTPAQRLNNRQNYEENENGR